MINREDCTFKINVVNEDTPVRGNAMSSGDDALDKAVEDRIMKDRRNNKWAWCTVEVECIHNSLTITGSDYLGCCSYKNQKDFMVEGGYYEDMCDQAFSQLKTTCETYFVELVCAETKRMCRQLSNRGLYGYKAKRGTLIVGFADLNEHIDSNHILIDAWNKAFGISCDLRIEQHLALLNDAIREASKIDFSIGVVT